MPAQKETIFIVDDTETNIDILEEYLHEDYNIHVAMDGEAALREIPKAMPDLILLDVMMPKMSGYEVCEKLKADELTRDIPVIFLTALSDEMNEGKGLNLGAVDYITKPFNPKLVSIRVKNHLLIRRHQLHLEDMVDERTKDLKLTLTVMMESLGTLAEFRDPETGYHIKATQAFVKALANQLSHLPKYKDVLNKEKIESLFITAPLHDIGKVGVPDSILHKPGPLTPLEFDEIKKHTTYAFRVLGLAAHNLKNNPIVACAATIAYTHHEKWDGSGYPNQLKGEEIPLEGRIMALADVYDALTRKRVYKDAMSHQKAKEIIVAGRGSHFDPDVVDAFLDIAEIFDELRDLDQHLNNLNGATIN